MIPSGDECGYLQYSTTQRGRIMLIYGGYKYVENRQSHKNIFWRCSRYVKYGCRATVVTSKVGDDVTVRIAGSPHTHEAEVSIEDKKSRKEYILNITSE